MHIEPHENPQYFIQQVNSLFEQQHVHVRDQRKLVKDILRTSMSTAWRRLNEGGWTAEEVRALFQHFNQTPPIADTGSFSVSGLYAPLPNPKTPEILCTARLESVNFNARAVLGKMIDKKSNVPFCGWIDTANNSWKIGQSDSAPVGVDLFSVKKFTYELEEPPSIQPKVAIIEDNSDTLKQLVGTLSNLDFEATGFLDMEQLLFPNEFSAYILDWSLNGNSAYQLVERIRANNASCPIFILTGKLGTRDADDLEIAKALRVMNVRLFEKPFSAIILADQINALLS